MNLTEQISKEINTKNDIPNFGAGDTITVYYKIREGNKERINVAHILDLDKSFHAVNVEPPRLQYANASCVPFGIQCGVSRSCICMLTLCISRVDY